MKATLSVVIPCFDEEDALPHLRPKLDELAVMLGDRYALEFVFVNDGSRDRTPSLLADVPTWGLHGAVRVETHPTNEGLGVALQTGFRAASGELITVLDCDGTLDPGYLPAMLDAMDEGTDIVSGSDLHPAGGGRGVPWFRLVLHRGLSTAYRWLFWSRLHAFSSILRIYRREVLERIDLHSRGFVVSTEILMKALDAGFVVKEHPVVLTARAHGRSKIPILRTIYDHVSFLVWLRWALWARRLRRSAAGATTGELRRAARPSVLQ